MKTIGVFSHLNLKSLMVFTEDEKTMSINYIGTANKARKNGYAQALVNHLYNNSPKTLLAQTDKDAVCFYHKMDFTMRKTRQKFGSNWVERYECKKMKDTEAGF